MNAFFSIDIWALILLLSERRAIINDLDVILHGFMLDITYTTIFRAKRLNFERELISWEYLKHL